MIFAETLNVPSECNSCRAPATVVIFVRPYEQLTAGTRLCFKCIDDLVESLNTITARHYGDKR